MDNPTQIAAQNTGSEVKFNRPKIRVERGATLESRFFDTEAEARRFCMKRGDHNELWRIEP